MTIINLKLIDIKESLPKKIIDRICNDSFKNINLYPQNYDDLTSIIAKKHKIDINNIVLINGVDEGIELILRVFGEDTLIFTPTYYEFLDAAKRNNLRIEKKNCFNEKEYKIKYIEKDIEKKSLILICNPNNPFGILKKETIVDIAKKTIGIVAVDETYIDFYGETIINEFEKIQNILTLRSFSKGHSLAGLRIGYIVGEKSLIEKIKNKKCYFNVSSVSVQAAIIALDEEEYFQKLISKIKERKNKFEEFLKNRKYNVIHTHMNSIVIKFQNKTEACKFHDYLKTNNVYVNQGNGLGTCDLDETFIRFAYGTEEQMKEVKKIIENFKDEKNE